MVCPSGDAQLQGFLCEVVALGGWDMLDAGLTSQVQGAVDCPAQFRGTCDGCRASVLPEDTT